MHGARRLLKHSFLNLRLLASFPHQCLSNILRKPSHGTGEEKTKRAVSLIGVDKRSLALAMLRCNFLNDRLIHSPTFFTCRSTGGSMQKQKQ